MSEKSQTLSQVATLERESFFSWRKLSLPSLPMIGLLVVVGFLVLTPLFLMILNSFQTARPGQPIVWGMEGWGKALNTPVYQLIGGASRTASVEKRCRRPIAIGGPM